MEAVTFRAGDGRNLTRQYGAERQRVALIHDACACGACRYHVARSVLIVVVIARITTLQLHTMGNDERVVKRIIDVELKGLYQRIEQVGYHIDLSEEAKEFVATKGYDVQFGARPLKRAIQNYIEDGISDLIVNGNLEPGATIHITLKDNELAFC